MADAALLAPTAKFSDPDVTAKGERRARVGLAGASARCGSTPAACATSPAAIAISTRAPTTTGSLISPAPRRPPSSTRSRAIAWPVREIGFTGGEPFMNPDIIDMLGDALSRGFSVLVLTNAMQPMLRPRIRDGLTALRDAHGNRLALRVSLDHYSRELHDTERTAGLVRQDGRRHRLAGARRLHPGAGGADLLGRERG